MNDFQLQLAGLKAGVTRLELVDESGQIGLDEAVWPGTLRLDLELDREGDQITLRGLASAETADECARCLAPVRRPLEFHFQAFADRRKGSPVEQELEADDYVIHHDGRVLDLRESLREQAILARPMLTLCRPECAGLCPRCGADRNQGPCTCGADVPGGAPGGSRAAARGIEE